MHLMASTVTNNSQGPPEKTSFGGKIRHHLASTFLISTIIFTSIPWILVIFPMGFLIGGIRAIFGPQGCSKTEKSEKLDQDVDSGISEHSESSESSENSSDDEKEEASEVKFDFQPISDKLKSLKMTETLGSQIIEYLAQCQKSMLMVTLRDVAILTKYPTSSENTVRIPYKKHRKMKIMSIPIEFLTEILENAGNSDAVLIYFFGVAKPNIEKLSQKFVHEIKEIIAENGENLTNLEKSAMEFLVINKHGITWINSDFS